MIFFGPWIFSRHGFSPQRFDRLRFDEKEQFFLNQLNVLSELKATDFSRDSPRKTYFFFYTQECA